MGTLSISESMLPLKMLEGLVKSAKQAKSKAKIDKGMKMMMKGMSLICEGAIDAIDEHIDTLIKTDKPQWSDAEFAEMLAVSDWVFNYLPEVIKGVDVKADSKVLIAKFIERMSMCVNLERQMRDGLAVPAVINIDEINRAVKSSSKGNLLAWVEA